ncbi:MAG TPA: FxLYD domain-containing protein [Anaerolineaceae bacterium]
MKPKFLLFVLTLALLLLVLAACSASTPSPTTVPPTVAPTLAPTTPPTATSAPTKAPPTAVPPTPTSKPLPPTATPQAGLHVVNFTSYKDSSGSFHVVGEIKNSDKKILTQMELTIEIKDASGASLLKDKNDKAVDSLTFSPMLSNLAPNESSPFDYTLNAGASTPDAKSVKVTVSGQNTSDVTRAAVQIQNAQMVASGADSYLVSGEIVNKGDKPVEIHDLAAALVDKNSQVISTDTSMNYAIYLKPAGDQSKLDTTPFYLRVNNPGTKPADFKTYLDAQEVEQPVSYAVKVDITNNYFDDLGAFHSIGNIINKSEDILTTQIVAGLYDKDGVVLDAYSTSSPVNLAVDEVMPYDISTFENVNGSPDEAKRLDHFTVQIDDYFTFPSSIETVPLKSANDKTAKNDTNTEWTVTGQVANNSSKNLSSVIVMVGVYDDKGNPVAVNYNYISPSGDSIAPGDVNSYKVVVVLDPKADTTGYTVKTLVKGGVK